MDVTKDTTVAELTELCDLEQWMGAGLVALVMLKTSWEEKLSDKVALVEERLKLLDQYAEIITGERTPQRSKALRDIVELRSALLYTILGSYYYRSLSVCFALSASHRELPASAAQPQSNPAGA